ncbi:MAG: DUF2764 family protein [Bacteroidales bacterium]|nr:DUF2764 family protein [Bacteroidales bacterium]MBR5780472.1 DUF2764 family protein [Bacteroidales bacterium]
MNIAGGNYYCLIAGLPEISPDDKKLSLSVHELRSYLNDYLSREEVDIINLFFYPNDNAQILRLLQKQEADPSLQTVFTVSQLEDEIEEPMFLPSYLKEYLLDLQKEDRETSKRLPEVELSERYWNFMLSQKEKLVRKYAEFSLNVKNLITALNCRKYHIDIEKEVIGDSYFVNQLKTSRAKDFELSDDYPYVDEVLALFDKDNTAEREYKIDMLYWDFLDEATGRKYFTFDNVIAFMLKLMILERWSKMTTEQGRAIFRELLERFRTGYKFSNQFDI